uniref:CPW-WPC domain-containing protein n=1 Tax=Alexandrium monilatum TaxID=311494 RepID=A0A6T1K530_9DINO
MAQAQACSAQWAAAKAHAPVQVMVGRARFLLCVSCVCPWGSFGYKGMPAVPILHGLADEMAQVYASTPRSVIDRAISAALVHISDRERVPLSEFVCQRDYGQACPQGWADVGDAGNCSAPAGYDGPCPAVVNFSTRG